VHADEAPDGRALADRLLARNDATLVRPRRRHDWRTWGLPLLSAAAVGAVVAGIVVVNDNHHQAAPQLPGNSTAVNPSPTNSGPGTALGFGAFGVTMLDAREGWALGHRVCGAVPCPPLPDHASAEDAAVVLHTTDGGAHWAELSSVANAELAGSDKCGAKQPCVSGVLFVDSENGYIYGANASYVTQDGGESWQSEGPADVYAMATAKGVAYRALASPAGCNPPGCSYLLQRKMYGSTTWTSAYSKAISASGSMSSGLQLVASGLDVYAMVYGHAAGGSQTAESTLVASHDIGATWNVLNDPCMPVLQRPGLSEIDSTAMSVAADGTLAVACSPRQQGTNTRGFVETSTDHGETFQGVSGDWFGSAPIVNVDAASATDVCATTEKAVLCTHGDLKSWTKTSTTNVLRFTSATDGYGLAIASDGTNVTSTFWTTHDAGITWQSSDLVPQQASPIPSSSPAPTDSSEPVDHSVADLSFVGTDDVWALTQDGIDHSLDGGKTWTYASVRADGVSQIRFATDDIGYAFGSGLFMTTNGGKTWTMPIKDDVEDVETLDGTVIVLTNPLQQLKIQVAAIGSSDFKTVTLPNGAGSFYGATLVRTRHLSVLKLGYHPAGSIQATPMFISTDGGYTWTERDDPCGSYGNSKGSKINTGAGWEVTTGADGSISLLCELRPVGDKSEQQRVATSTDGGKTFTYSVTTDVTNSGRNNLVTPDAHTYLVSDGQGLLRSTDAGATWNRVLSRYVSNGPSLRCGFETSTVGRCTDESTIWTTRDAGASWTSQPFVGAAAPAPHISVLSTPSPPITQSMSSECGDMLSIQPQPEGDALGHGGRKIIFTNTGEIYCNVSGYPMVGYVNPQTVAKQTLSGYLGGIMKSVTPQEFELAPGDQVSVVVEWANNPSRACPDPGTKDSMFITVPGGSKHTLGGPIGTCLLEVHPFVAGTTGSDS
jgi:photosystem II stability/assembly factor-like uncharacterized protein